MSRDKNDETGFLSRWSRRKQQHDMQKDSDAEAELPVSETNTEQQNEPESEAQSQQAEARPLPIWQQEGVDAETKKAALRKLFHKPEFNVRDGLNEYDDDFTQFASLGNIVTHEMKRLLKMAEEKTRPDEQDETASSAATKQTDPQPSDKEDDGIA